MKSFKDLKFKSHSVIPGGTHATMNFPNGTFISVVTGTGTYSGRDTYEVMSSMNEDPLARVTPKKIDSIMQLLQT